MDRDVAIRLDGMLTGAIGHLDGIAHYMKNNLPSEEYDALIGYIGGSMAELIDISTSLHKQFPDIIPKELKPSGE
ncbi:MAG: hypothetical protein ABSC22_14605 [Roseiarcus sp.]|jgi:hypothetical protein